MNKLADLIEANKEVLAAVDSWDNGEHTPLPIMSEYCTVCTSTTKAANKATPQENPTP